MGHLTEGNWNNVDDLQKDDFTHGYAQYKGIYTIIDLTVIKPDYLKRIATKASANGENFPKTYDDRKGEYLLLKNFGPYIGRDYDKCYFNSIDDIINTLKGLNESMNIKDRIKTALDEDRKIRQNTRWSEEDQPKLYMIDRFLRKNKYRLSDVIVSEGRRELIVDALESSHFTPTIENQSGKYFINIKKYGPMEVTDVEQIIQGYQRAVAVVNYLNEIDLTSLEIGSSDNIKKEVVPNEKSDQPSKETSGE